MATIRIIREKMSKQEYEFAITHFFEEMAGDDISFEDVEMAISNGRIIRKFNQDPRGARYEVVDSMKEGREIAII